MKKRIICFMLSAMMALGGLAGTAVAADPTSPAVISNEGGTIDEMYVGAMGTASEGRGESADNPTSWDYAAENVAPGGTIHVVYNDRLDHISLKTDAEYKLNATVKPYLSNSNKLLYLFQITDGANITFTGTTFDGGNEENINYNPLSVEDGTLTLNNCTVKDFENSSYGAAIWVSTNSTATLNATAVTNNHLCKYDSPQYGGGITVGGTLNVNGASSITGNTMYGDSDALDILLNSSGTVNVDGAATIGTVGIAYSASGHSGLYIKSALESNINVRVHRFSSSTVKLFEFAWKNILVWGANGYKLTESDREKILIPTVPSSARIQYRTRLNSTDNQVFVDELYVVGKYRNMTNGEGNGGIDLSIARAYPGDEVIFTPQPATGYRYRTGSIFIDNNAGDKVYSPVAVEGTNGFSLIMPRENIYVMATFDAIPPAQTPNIVIDYKNEMLTGFNSGEKYTIDEIELTANAAGEISAVQYMGKTISIVKKGVGTDTLDSAAQSLPVPARPVPTVTATKTTSNSARDGKITINMTNAEYKAVDSNNYTPVVGNEITGIAMGTYSVRIVATDISFKSATIAVNVLSAGSITHEITGKAEDDANAAAQNATVRLYLGTKLLSEQTTDNLGAFTFTEIPNGLYQLVVIYSGVTVTVEALVAGADVNTGTLVVPASSKNSIVELTEEAPPMVVDQLPTVFDTASPDADKGVTQAELDGLAGNTISNITIKLTADSKTEETAENAADIKAEAQNDRKMIGSFVDLSVYKVVTTASSTLPPAVTTLVEVPDLLKITIPLTAEQQRRNEYVIYRYHDTVVQTIKEGAVNKNADGEYFDVDTARTTITLYTKKFSTYAIAYTRPVAVQSLNSITVSNAPGGSISSSHSSANSGNTVSVTVTPEKGYRVDRVLVKTASGASVTVKGAGENRYTFEMPDSAVTVTAEFVRDAVSPAISGVSDMLITDRHFAYLYGTGNDNFSPNANMSRAEVAQMFYNLLIDKNVAKTASFADVADTQWYAEAVNTLAGLKIIEGFNGNYRPNDAVTRAEFTSIAMRFAKMTEGECSFSDVAKTDWAYKHIAAATTYGWVSGYSDGTFRPLQNMSRAEVTTLVNIMLGRAADKTYIEANKAQLKIFSDMTDTSYWAWYSIVEATNAHTFNMSENEKWTAVTK